MNSIAPIPKPCRTVEEWLASHEVTRCPPGYALGLSGMELERDTVAFDGKSFVEVVRQQQANEVRAKRHGGTGKESK